MPDAAEDTKCCNDADGGHTYQCLAAKLGERLDKLSPEAKVAFVVAGSEYLEERLAEKPNPLQLSELLKGITCDHPNMAECHKGCGHWTCPDCGVSFDDGAQQ